MTYGEDFVTDNEAEEKSATEIKYEQYLACDDKTKIIDGVVFYKAVSVEFYPFLYLLCDAFVR